MSKIVDRNSSEELRQLAHLLRLGVDSAREIASRRRCDAEEIGRLADQGTVMANDLDRIAARSIGDNGKVGGPR